MAKAKAKAKKAPETAVFVEEYKGKETFSIWNVDEDGDKIGDYPVIAFGITKAKALLKHAEDLETYVSDQDAAAQSHYEDDDEDEKPAKKKGKKEEPKKKKKPKIVRRNADSDEDE